MTNDTYFKKRILKQEWEELCSREEEYWRQKSRELWLQQGDKNTIYFHALAKKKRASQTIFKIKESNLGYILINAKKIRDEGVKFFKNILAPIDHPLPLPSQVEDFI